MQVIDSVKGPAVVFGWTAGSTSMSPARAIRIELLRNDGMAITREVFNSMAPLDWKPRMRFHLQEGESLELRCDDPDTTGKINAKPKD